MKRTDILPTLEKLFADRDPSSVGTYKICWLHGRLQLLSTAHLHQGEIVLGVVHREDLDTGLTPAHWQRIEDKIIVFLTQKGYL